MLFRGIVGIIIIQMDTELTKNKIKKIANDVKIELDERELNEIESYANFVLEKVKFLHNVKTDDIAPTTFPIAQHSHTLRDDVVQSSDSQKILNSAKNKRGKYIVIK
jgi:aspartyl/glutamyl-tRNA(Asn/Gln) amidotransferase C subunit